MELGAPDHAPGSSLGGSTTTVESSQRGSGSFDIPVVKAAPFREGFRGGGDHSEE